jgi:glycosyltransferase involved in cell wall biosynthesis
MKLSIIIPAYNEVENIDQVIAAVQKVDISPVEKEIIVVDDGSTDGTKEILERHKNEGLIKVHISEANGGKGTAIRIGLTYATGDYVLIQDADLEYSPEEYPNLLKPILEGKAQVVYGSRFRGKVENMQWPNLFANKFLTAETNLLFRTGITDVFTCYKVFDRELINSLNLTCKRFEFCQEVTAKVAKKHVKIYEVPIAYNGRAYTEGKKIGARDGFEALWTLLKYRFTK